MARIVCVAAQKGGVGKTTVGIQGSLVTSLYLGRRTLLIDVDPQCNSSNALIEQAQKTDNPDCIASNLYRQGTNVIPIKGKHGVDVIPGDDGINSFPQDLNEEAFANIVARLSGDLTVSVNEIIQEVVDVQLISFAENIQKFAPNYDYIFIDVPPSFLGLPLISALVASTDIVGLVEPNKFSEEVIESFIQKVDLIHDKYNPELTFHGFIINKLRATSARHKERAKQWMEQFPDFFLGNPIKMNSWIEESAEDGEPVWRNTTNNHRKTGAKNLIVAMSDFLPELKDKMEKK